MRRMRLAAILLVFCGSIRAAAQTGLDDRALQAAIQRELDGVPPEGHLDVAVKADGTATVSYLRPDGSTLERTVVLPARDDEAVEMLALLAGNLVRDQAGDVIADLEPVPSATRRYTRKMFTVGIFPPLSTDLVYGEPVVSTFAGSLFFGVTPGVRGASISGGIDVQTDDTKGIHVAPLGSLALRDVDGLQLAGLGSLTFGHHEGIQLAGAVSIARSLRGVQVAGGFNGAGSLTGAQVSPLNVAGRVRGVQLGLFNYAEDIDGAQIGLISIVRRGLTEVDVSGESHRTLHLVLRHGKPRFHTLYGVASAPPGDQSVQLFGLGFGTRLIDDGDFDLDVGVMTWRAGGPGVDAGLSLLNQARLGAAFGVGRRLALVVGVALNVYVADTNENGDAFHPMFDKTYVAGETVTRLWPSVFAGIRVR